MSSASSSTVWDEQFPYCELVQWAETQELSILLKRSDNPITGSPSFGIIATPSRYSLGGANPEFGIRYPWMHVLDIGYPLTCGVVGKPRTPLPLDAFSRYSISADLQGCVAFLARSFLAPAL
jgi:hypothetical protein